MSSAATTIGCQAPPSIGAARSSARPIEPTCGAESKVEQTLYCVTGAPSPASARKAGGRLASIQAGPFERATPATPTTRWPPARAEPLGRGRVEEQHRRQAGEGGPLHRGRRAGEVVAVEGQQQAVGQARAPPVAPSSARANARCSRARSASGTPAIAASQA